MMDDREIEGTERFLAQLRKDAAELRANGRGDVADTILEYMRQWEELIETMQRVKINILTALVESRE